MPRLALPLGFLCLAVTLAPAPCESQAVRVRVLAAESREPITTAFVSLTDEEGTPLRHALTNPAGESLFSIHADETYRLRAQMFGRETAWSPFIEARPDSTIIYVFELAVEPIPLAEVRVEPDQQCSIHPEDREELARVWEEVRKALSIQDWTDAAGLYRFTITAWDRRLDKRGEKVEAESLRELSTILKNPIQSLPVEDLMTGGFIRNLDDGRAEYFGPDASILLSNLFLNGHCFQLSESVDHPGSIGLAFEPADQEMPDIDGTIWVDRNTAHLQLLEFRYVNAPKELTEGIAGGRVEFERLPDGAWIVRTWWIRIPIRDYTWIFGRKHLVGIHERGQVVSEITRLPGGELQGGGSPHLDPRPHQ